jgi:hypothetical protein
MSGVVNWVNDNIVQPVINNPVAAIVDVGLMAMGVPPVYAMAAGAGANTAAKGGSAEDIIKSAVVGGASAYVGGAAAQYVGNAGYAQALSGAAGGAAGGATAAALTGQNILKGAATGGVTGGIIGGGMQYLAGSGAVNPAAAGSQMTRAEYAASIPDEVLAEAVKTSDPVGYVNKQMGFTGQGTSAGGVNDALADYRMASTPAVQPTTTPVTTAPVSPVVPDINTALAVANAPGVIDPLGTLIQQMNWSPAATAASSAAVADKFGQQSAEQAAKARLSKLTSQQQSNMNVRVPGLLTEAQNNANIDSIMAKSPDTSSVIKNLGWSDNQFTQEAATRLLDDYKATNTAQQTLANQQAEYIRTHQVTAPPTPTVAPVAPVEPTTPTQPAPATINANGGIDLGKPSPEIANMTNEQVNQAIKNNTPPPITPVQPAPANTVDVGGGNYMDQKGNIVDINGNITKPAIQPGPPSAPLASTDYKIEIGGRAGLVGSEDMVKGPLSPGSQLATIDQINNGSAQWNAASNAWEVPAPPTVAPDLKPITQTEIPPTKTIPTVNAGEPTVVSTEQVTSGGVPYIVTHYSNGAFSQVMANPPVAPVAPQPAGAGSAVVTPQTPINTSSTITTPPTTPAGPPTVVSSEQKLVGGTLYNVTHYSDGSFNQQPVGTISQPAGAGSAVVTPQTPINTSSTITNPTPTIPVAQPAGDGSAVVRPQVPIDTSSTITPGTTQTEQPLIPLVPTPVTPTQPVTNVDISAGGPTTPDTVIHNPAPYVGLPITTPDTTTKPTTHYGTFEWGKGPQLQIPSGLNPGYMQPTDFYNTTSPVQSHYYWGGHPYQPGPTFNQQLYNTVPNAPGTPWGLQQSFNPNYVYPVAP